MNSPHGSLPAPGREVEDAVGFYLTSLARAFVSIDARSKIRALDRAHFGLSRKPGQSGRMTHDEGFVSTLRGDGSGAEASTRPRLEDAIAPCIETDSKVAEPFVWPRSTQANFE